MYPAVLDDIMNEVWEAYESIGQNLLMKPFNQFESIRAVNNWVDGEIDELKETIKNKYNANVDIKSSTSFNNIDGKYSICVQLSGDPNVYMQKEDGWECLRVANPQELPL